MVREEWRARGGVNGRGGEGRGEEGEKGKTNRWEEVNSVTRGQRRMKWRREV